MPTGHASYSSSPGAPPTTLRCGKYLAEIIHQLPCGLVSPSTMTAYGAQPDLAGVLMIGVEPVRRLARSGAVTGSGADPRRPHHRDHEPARVGAPSRRRRTSTSRLARNARWPPRSHTRLSCWRCICSSTGSGAEAARRRLSSATWVRSCSARTSMSPNWPSATASLRGWSVRRAAIPIQRLGRPR